MTRRGMIGLLPAAALLQAQTEGIPSKLRTRTSKEIAASPISIGFETLDRKMFDPERTYEHLAKLGVKWARCQTGWARTETRKGQYDFAWLDSVVDSLLKIGIQPWFNLGYGNTLYTPGPNHESAVGWVPMNSDEARAAWTRFVATIGERYAKRVKHWELWNEPNISNFWQPDKPAGKAYVDFVKLTAPVLRKTVPGCTLIGGAFAGLNSWKYFEDCFEAGLAGQVDRISYHPYRAVPEDGYEADLRAFRGLINRYKPGMPIWQGENGAPSTNNSTGALSNLEWDEGRQAKWLLRRLITDLSLDVEVTSYFQTVDMMHYVWSSGKSDKTNSKGVLRGGVYTPKASYYALQNLCSLFDGETKRADLLLRVGSDKSKIETQALQTASFVRKGAPLFAYWYPANLQQGFATPQGSLTLWTGKAAKLEKPVLVDLLTGDITEPKDAKRTDDVWHLSAVPVRDYPLVVTDASTVL